MLEGLKQKCSNLVMTKWMNHWYVIHTHVLVPSVFSLHYRWSVVYFIPFPPTVVWWWLLLVIKILIAVCICVSQHYNYVITILDDQNVCCYHELCAFLSLRPTPAATDLISLSHFEGVVVVFFYHDVLFERKIGFFFDIESFEI